ncbi:hypothetical protein [Yaniella sp.]
MSISPGRSWVSLESISLHLSTVGELGEEGILALFNASFAASS